MFQIIYGKKALKFIKKQDKPSQKRLIQATFLLNNVEEVAPEPEELAALNAYHSGDPDYHPVFSQEEVLKELGL